MTVYAVDFKISNVQIDVYLKEDGKADVIETHTYDFNSEFNGITRELHAKDGASITNFEAYEQGKSLKVEEENNLYKVYRSGEYETVHIELHYLIHDAVEKYEDGAQLYWPFFDDRNETEYGNMTIIVHPPGNPVDIDFLGYDAAYNKGEILTDGAVQFALGLVPEWTNGDVRVIYEPTLFPSLEVREGKIRHDIRADKERIEEDIAMFLEKQQEMRGIGLYTFTGFALFLFGLLSYMTIKNRGMKQLASSLVEETMVPGEKLSMPATMYYTKLAGTDAAGMSAALLDLIRKGYVKQLTEERFELVDTSEANAHETILMNLLFNQVGDGTEFNLNDLEVYTTDEMNHEPYGESLDQWRSAIVKEVKQAGLYENKTLLRWFIGLISVALLPLIIQLASYEVYSFMALLIVLSLGGLLIALVYNPPNLEGAQVIEEWRRFNKRFKDIEIGEWEKLPVDDKYRAYIYGIGVNDASLQEMHDGFERAEKRYGMVNTPAYVAYDPIYMSDSFSVASSNASVSTGGDSSSSSDGGGGEGGGGGGSGAF